MLDQLVESRNDSNNTRRGGFLLTTSILIVSLFASGILWSLFAKDLGGNENLELSSLVTPVKLPDDNPPPPEPVKQIKQDQTQKVENSLPVRNDNIARIDENQPTPDKISTVQSNQKARPVGDFKINPDGKETEGIYQVGRDNPNGNTGAGISKPLNAKEEKPETEDVPPPTMTKKAVEQKAEKPTIIRSGMVLNGKAISLPKPSYPAPARAVHASGDVNVQVTIDEQGNVISANAVSGHALLKQAAESAARRAKFTPTLLSNQPVKVTGIIVYKFAM